MPTSPPTPLTAHAGVHHQRETTSSCCRRLRRDRSCPVPHRLGLPRLQCLRLLSLHVTAQGGAPVIARKGVKSSSSLCAAGKSGARAPEKRAASHRAPGRSGAPVAAFLARGSPPELLLSDGPELSLSETLELKQVGGPGPPSPGDVCTPPPGDAACVPLAGVASVTWPKLPLGDQRKPPFPPQNFEKDFWSFKGGGGRWAMCAVHKEGRV
ncbi:UNVERIFIED_CONTAM: hypothetical protein FKN15_019453 [Acipenser sinensis]